VLKAGVNRPPTEIEQEIVHLVREKIGPVAAFKIALTVTRLPKTRSGKILRGTMRKIAEGQDYPLPATIEDPAVLRENRQGFGRGRLRQAVIGSDLPAAAPPAHPSAPAKFVGIGTAVSGTNREKRERRRPTNEPTGYR